MVSNNPERFESKQIRNWRIAIQNGSKVSHGRSSESLSLFERADRGQGSSLEMKSSRKRGSIRYELLARRRFDAGPAFRQIPTCYGGTPLLMNRNHQLDTTGLNHRWIPLITNSVSERSGQPRDRTREARFLVSRDRATGQRSTESSFFIIGEQEVSLT